MKMTEYSDHWEDPRGNSWDKKTHDRRAAEAAANTLKDCTGCRNCSDCTQCVNCEACSMCCSCVACRDCTGLEECVMCARCRDLLRCTACDDCASSDLCACCWNCECTGSSARCAGTRSGEGLAVVAYPPSDPGYDLIQDFPGYDPEAQYTDEQKYLMRRFVLLHNASLTAAGVTAAERAMLDDVWLPGSPSETDGELALRAGLSSRIITVLRDAEPLRYPRAEKKNGIPACRKPTEWRTPPLSAYLRQFVVAHGRLHPSFPLITVQDVTGIIGKITGIRTYRITHGPLMYPKGQAVVITHDRLTVGDWIQWGVVDMLGDCPVLYGKCTAYDGAAAE